MSETPSNDGAGSNYKEGWTGVGKWWYASAVVVLVVVLGLVFVLLDIGGDDDQKAGPTQQPSPGVGSSSGAPTSPPEDLAPGGFVDLPAPVKATEGYPTHYPQTPEGAAATAAVSAMAVLSLDYEELGTILPLYITGIDLDQSSADAIVSKFRTDMGLPLSGPPPAGAGVAAEIEGIKWRVVDDTHVVVSYQERITFTVPGQAEQNGTGAATASMVWVDGRWFVDGTVPDPKTEVYSEPGSEQFVNDGYNVIRNLDWAGGLS